MRDVLELMRVPLQEGSVFNASTAVVFIVLNIYTQEEFQ